MLKEYDKGDVRMRCTVGVKSKISLPIFRPVAVYGVVNLW